MLNLLNKWDESGKETAGVKLSEVKSQLWIIATV